MNRPKFSFVSALRALWNAVGLACVAYALTVTCVVWLATVQPRNAGALEEHAVQIAMASLGESSTVKGSATH